VEFIANNIWRWLIASIVMTLVTTVFCFSLLGRSVKVWVVLFNFLLASVSSVPWILFCIALVLKMIQYAKHA